MNHIESLNHLSMNHYNNYILHFVKHCAISMMSGSNYIFSGKICLFPSTQGFLRVLSGYGCLLPTSFLPFVGNTRPLVNYHCLYSLTAFLSWQQQPCYGWPPDSPLDGSSCAGSGSAEAFATSGRKYVVLEPSFIHFLLAIIIFCNEKYGHPFQPVSVL